MSSCWVEPSGWRMDSWYASPSAISVLSMSETYMVIVLVPMGLLSLLSAHSRTPTTLISRRDNHSDQRFATTGGQIGAQTVREYGQSGPVPTTGSVGMTRSGGKWRG